MTPRLLLHLAACLSIRVHAPRPALLHPTLSTQPSVEEVATRQQEATTALLAYPWLLSVTTISQSPAAVAVMLAEDAPPDALEVAAAVYAELVDPPWPVEAQAWGCVDEMWMAPDPSTTDGRWECTRWGVVARSSGRY